MNTAATVLLGAILALVVIWVAWRIASRHASIPCPTWLSWLLDVDVPLTSVYRTAKIVERLDVSPGMRVLDVGCGPGRVTVPLASAVGPTGEVVAVDIQPEMLDRAREKAAAAGLDNIRFVQAPMGAGSLDVANADRALLVTVLGEIPEREAALREIFDTLAPGGVLSVTEIVFDPHFQRRAVVESLAEQAGFRECAFYGSRAAFTLNLMKPMNAGPHRAQGSP